MIAASLVGLLVLLASSPSSEGADQRTEVSLQLRALRIDGAVLAREEGTPSASARPLGIRKDLDVEGGPRSIEAYAAFHLTPDDVISAEFTTGESSGTSRLAAETAFDDVSFQAGETARTRLLFWKSSIGYRHRIVKTTIKALPVVVEVGGGFSTIGATTTLRTPSATDSEDVVAPMGPGASRYW